MLYPKKSLFISLISVLLPLGVLAQAGSDVNPRPITLEEYELAHTQTIEDLDNVTYVKFDDGQYIFDRYEMRKPIYITGDDGLRKRVDIYKFIARNGLQELGTMIFYTNEKNELFKALVPNYTASGDVWERYFEDIHSINNTEENFVLKLSYVISRELAFQMYKGMNNGQLTDTEHATYGSDICFPGDQLVTLDSGESLPLHQIKKGDKIIAFDPASGNSSMIEVSKLVSHTPENYAISELTLLQDEKNQTEKGLFINLSFKTLKATPNHPMMTNEGKKEIGKIREGEEVLTWNPKNKSYESYTVFNTRELTDGVQPVYSIEAEKGSTLLINGVVVRQK